MKRRLRILLKSRKNLYFLLVLSMILLIGTGICSAENIAENNTVYSDDTIEDDYETTDENVDVSFKNIEKVKTENTKSEDNLMDLSLETEDIECDYGDYVDIDVITTPEVDEGVLSWFINGRLVGAKNLSNSPASYTLRTAGYLPGNYEIMVSYSSSLNYINNQTTANLKINKLDTKIENVVYSFDEDNNISVSLNIMDSMDNGIDYGTLNVYNDTDLILSVEVEDYDVSFIINRKYNRELLTFEYLGDDYYNDALENELVNLNKFNMNIYLPSISVYQSHTVNESVVFYSDRKVNDGILNVYVDGVLKENIPINNGNADVVFDTKNYPSGSHVIYIEYVDSDVYIDTYYQSNLNIKQIATKIYTSNITAHRNDIINLEASVYNYVDQTDEGMIEFILDDESIETEIVTNTSISSPYTVPDNLEYGIHNLSIIYYGSQKYQTSNASAVINIIKYATTLSLQKTSLDDDGNIVLTIREYSYNNTVDDGDMEVLINNISIGTYDVTGNVTNVTLPEVYSADNTYNLTVIYRNSEKFEDVQLNTTISTQKYDTSTRLYSFTDNQNILNITSYVYSSDYSVINEGVVEFYINDTLISITNLENNQASTTLDLDNFEEKNYSIKAEYKGTRTYRESANSTEIKYSINRKTVYITTDYSIKTLPGEIISINARLTDYESNTVNLTTPAQINILNQTVSANFNEGILILNYHITSQTPEDTYNITIIINQTKYYKNATKTIKLTVAKNSPYITGKNTIYATKSDTVLINATLNMNGEKLEENITGILKINNKTVYQGIFINGEFQYKLALKDKYTSNSYNITIKSKETTKYHTAQKDITLYLNNKETYITSNNIISKNGERIYINATIYDKNTKKTVTGTSKVCIKINEVTLDNIEVKNGHLVYSYINDYSSKNYTIHIIYGGNGIYNSSQWTGTLTIMATSLQIATGTITANAQSTINIKADIYAENKLAEGPIQTAIKIDNKTILHENITDGIIDVNFTLNEDIKGGEHNITIVAGDTRKYTGNTSTVTLFVNKNYKQINSTDITAQKASTILIKADILDMNNNPITTKTPVNIKIASKSIITINITGGHMEYEYTLPSNMKNGVYDILIQAGETNTYLHASKNYVLTVE